MNIEALFKISYGLYIICSGSNDKYNGYIANTVFQVTAEPPLLAVSCSKNNFTAKFIEDSKVFTISVLQKDAKSELIGRFGYKSGKDFDKFTDTQYITADTGVPIVSEDTISWFECDVVQSADVGTHIIFIGKVRNMDVISGSQEPLTYQHYRDTRKGVAPKNAPTYIDKSKIKPKESGGKKYRCLICGYVYDPELGDEDNDIPAGTAFEALPEDWECPICSAKKEDFELLEE